jgi:filamentous hemagglutinin family protein
MLKNKPCLAILTLLCLTGGISSAQAQTYTPSNRAPVADSTLGTQVTGTGNNFNITGGLVKGQTLFHSFTDFSVPTNGRVDFTNPVGNRDIITRVTGASFSDINGIVNTSGANFFLINPNGIVFGTGAQLNVGKAFVGSTASSLDLVAGNGSTINFGTNPSGDAPLLSVAPNVMFDVSRLNLGGGTGAISNFGTLKTTNPNQYIGLIGGNVTMNGGQIVSPGGRVEIGGLSAPGTVTLGVEENNLRAQLPPNVSRGNVSLTNQAQVGVTGREGGTLVIDAGNIYLSNATLLTNSGAIAISGTSLLLQDRANISSDSSYSPYAGNIDINISGAIDLDNSQMSSVISQYLPTAEAVSHKASNINIAANSVSLRNNSEISSVAISSGTPGTIKISASNFVNIFRSSVSISTVAVLSGTDGSGDIFVTAPEITLDRGSLGITLSFTPNSLGSININNHATATPGKLLLLRNGSQISTTADDTEQRINDGWTLTPLGVWAPPPEYMPSLQGGSYLGAFDAGNININSALIVAVPSENSDITANATRGTGGQVNITAQGIYGIEFQPQQTPNSDITASSTFGQSGAVKVSTPGTDPGKDSTELPKVPTDASKQISQACGSNNRQNKLTVAGRGGLPANANDLLTADVLWQDAAAAESQPLASNVTTTPNLAPPAVGFVFDGKGKVTLVAAGTSGQPTGTKISCPQEVR